MLSFGCSAEDPDSTGHVVASDGACHQLLQLNCTCCGTGESNCRTAVDWGVTNGTRRTAHTELECAPLLTTAKDDADAYCASLGTGFKLELACNYFVGEDDADVTE